MMKSRNGYLLNILVTGFMTIVVLSVVLFIGRFLCLETLLAVMPDRFSKANISPSGLVNQIDALIKEKSGDPNRVAKPSQIMILTGNNLFGLSLGAFEEHYNLRPRWRQIISPDIRFKLFDKKSNTFHILYFDRILGLFVNCDITRSDIYPENTWTKTIQSYVGPEGFSKTPDESLGRFIKPLRFVYNANHIPIVYDQKLSRFVRIDFAEERVTKGPQIEYEIVQVGRVSKNEKGISGPLWILPKKQVIKVKKRRERVQEYTKYQAVGTNMGIYDERDWEPVLEKSGLIFKLDRETLELSGPVGRLPGSDPDKLFAYDVKGFSVDGKHEGLLVGYAGANVFRPGLLVFDKSGTRINHKHVKINFKEFGGGPGLSIANYVLETLQPAVFGLISYFTTYSFDGAGGPRSLFILPNSHLARVGGKRASGDVSKYAVCIGMLLPSLIIGVLLAGRIERDAKVVGISARAKFWWVAVTIVFGLSAYITYRLTRPKDTLVSCVNCGQMRRPDMERCHQCQSLWDIPELVPPMWRVIETT